MFFAPLVELRDAARWNPNRFFIRVISALAIIASFALVAPAEAAFIVFAGNIPQAGDENVLLNNDDVGTSIQGTLNNSAAQVVFTSSSQFIAGPSGGQARVEGRTANNIAASLIDLDDSLTISLLPPTPYFASVIFNVFDGTGSIAVKVTGINPDLTPAVSIITLDNDSNAMGINMGSNFYTLLATGGMLMTSVEIEPLLLSTYKDLRQVRIGGVVPEPGVATLGSLAALSMFRTGRRRPANRGQV